MQLLLNDGADVNAQGGEYGNALQAAEFDGTTQAIWVLLDKGADNAQSGVYGAELQAAFVRDAYRQVDHEYVLLLQVPIIHR